MRLTASNGSSLFAFFAARAPPPARLIVLLPRAAAASAGAATATTTSLHTLHTHLICRRFRSAHNLGVPRSGLVRSMNTTSELSAATATASKSKELWVLRHGQAEHNVRAEAAREEDGCSWDEFLELMRQDDAFDADLTALGREQARQVHETHHRALAEIDAVVSSPLSRALETAELAAPDAEVRVVDESFREISGLLLNARRRTRSELSRRFPRWSLEGVSTERDADWSADALEDRRECGERGYRGLAGIMGRLEVRRVLLVAHGGLLRLVMAEHPAVVVRDGRVSAAESAEQPPASDTSALSSETPPKERRRPSHARFGNCELRRYRMEWADNAGEAPSDAAGPDPGEAPSGARRSEPPADATAPRRILLLTELDIPTS